MIKIIGSVLVVGMFALLSRADRFVAPLLLLSDSDSSESPHIVRGSPPSEASTTARAPGFRTNHVLVPTLPPNQYDSLIELNAQRMGLSFGLVRAVVEVESGFDPSARSTAGYAG